MRWNGADLERRLCAALDIARKTIDYFAVSGHTDRERPALGFGGEKPVAETAMLLYAASACSERPAVARRIADLVRLVEPHARSERVLVDIALHPAVAFKYAVPHVLLTRIGYPDRDFDRLLRACVRSSVRNGHDRPPSAFAERQWVASLWSRRQVAGDWHADLRDSVLRWPIDVLGGSREDAYAFTHLLFYCSDFGFQAPRLPRRRAVILGEAAALLARYMDAEDYDLSGELLMSWPLTGRAWSPAAAFGFRVLARVEDRVGVLPCANVDLPRLAALEGDERIRYALGTAYHTAYVMGFLCAVSLQPGKAPPTTIVGRRFSRTCLDALQAYVTDDQGHWQSELATLARDEREALAPFVLDVAIVQKSRQHDYEALRKLLSLARDNGMARSPLCRQAAQLLDRIAHCAIGIDHRRRASAAITQARDVEMLETA